MEFMEMIRRLFRRADDCHAVRGRFVDRMIGQLAEAREAKDAAHLAGCEACRDAYSGLLEAWNGLPDAPGIAPPAHVSERVLVRARQSLSENPAVGGSGRWSTDRAQRRARRYPARRRLRWLLPLTALAGAMGILLVTLVIRKGDASPIAIGREMPDFRVTQVATGDDRSLSGYRGEVVLLHVWATWCTPCEREMPTLERLERRLGPEGFRVVAVSIDRESRHKVQRWADERGLDLLLLQDRTGEIERRYEVVGVPETFLIGPDGVLLWRGAGAHDWDDPDQAAIVHQFLRRGGAS